MESIIVAAVSVRNEIGKADLSIENMKRWISIAKDKSADLILFPELNVSGYIPAPVARKIAEPVSGPSTEKILEIAQKEDIYIAFGIIEEEKIFERKGTVPFGWFKRAGPVKLSGP